MELKSTLASTFFSILPTFLEVSPAKPSELLPDYQNYTSFAEFTSEAQEVLAAEEAQGARRERRRRSP